MNKLDYSNEDVMNILNNPNYSDDAKKELFEKYKLMLKENRKKEIINRLNICAKENPIITQEVYVNFLKKYNDDDLSKPFDVIEKEIDDFSTEMKNKYNEYLKQKELEEQAKNNINNNEEQVKTSEVENKKLDNTSNIFENNNEEEIKPTNYINNTNNEENPTVLEKGKVKEVSPDDNLDEKGNASAIIISIIAIILGMVIMYTIIKLK